MKELLKNKKTLIPILIGVAIIIIAIIAFIIIGITGKKSDSRVSSIKLDNSTPVSNTTENEVQNETENNTGNTARNEIDEDIDFGVEEFYQDAAKKFIAGWQDEDEMQDFIDNHFDAKAFVAYDNIDGDESKFLEEYEGIADDDEQVEKVVENLLSLPDAMEELTALVGAFGEMAESMDNTTNAVSNESFDASELEISLKLTDISDPEVSENDENISKVTLTVDFSGQEQEMIMVFYGDIAIFMSDTEGNSVLDSMVNE